MIDPRFTNAGAVPFVPGFGAQPVPANYHHRHRHHHHHKHKGRHNESPLSRDESIHKVDHGHQHNVPQNEQIAFGGGYGVPYGSGAGGFQQQQFGGANFGYANQYQGAQQFDAGQAGPTAKHHRRHHHRHHRHHPAEAVVGTTGGEDQAQAVPEQLIGQRSSSVLVNEAQPARSPAPFAEGEAKGEKVSHHRHRHHHHHHHHSGEHSGLGHTHQSRRAQHHGHSSAGADGYGHINDDLIFIERGEHSPHRQEPPPGYEYQGKIEVQGYEKEYRSQSRGAGSLVPPPPVAPPHVVPPSSLGPCPPGWQQMVLSSGAGGLCPPGGAMYTGQLVGGAGVAQTGFGGSTGGVGFSGVGPIGASGFGGGGLANLAASLPFPPQGQLVADYIVESAAGGISSSGGSGFVTEQHETIGTSGAGFSEQVHREEVEEHISSRPTVFEVWQRRKKSPAPGKSRSRSRSQTPGPSFDFDRFRSDILAAIERIVHYEAPKPQGPGQSGGTQTQILPERERPVEQKREAGEVRVIVQPIQPVFYMPQQTGNVTTQVGPAPPGQTVTSSGAPNVVYVPRNVYVPVIKPVFVPRERVIIRPQVIHVARPVLVDRPVPVTQRPIIIDRERPIPVPVRGGNQGAAQGGGSRVVQEEYVYRDNLPVAYGGRCAEFSGGTNYGYTAAQQEQQYATSSAHEASNIYQGQGSVINVNVPNQFEHSGSASHLNVQQGGGGGGGSFHGSQQNLARVNSASAVNVGRINQQVIQQTFEQSAQAAGIPVNVPTQIEILDTAVNPFWQKTDQPTLMRRYGRPAFEIVHKTDQVEQQMYNELRQRNSSGGVQRSVSSASYGSGSGIGGNSGLGGGGLNY